MASQIQVVIDALQRSLLGINQEMRKAEETLNQYLKIPGYITLLLQILGSKEIALPIKQAASIQLKRCVRSHWTEPDLEYLKQQNLYVLSAEDKQFTRLHIVDAMTYAERLPRSQLELCIATIVDSDYEKGLWPELPPKILALISSKDYTQLYGGLSTLRILLRNWEFVTPGSKKEPMYEIIAQTFDLLLQLFTDLSNQATNDQLLGLKLLLLKSFYSSINFGLPPKLRDANHFAQWMNLILKVLLDPYLPPNFNPAHAESEDLDKLLIFKTKKWAGRIFTKLFNRYGSPKQADKSDKQFCITFGQVYTPKLLETFLGILNMKRAGNPIPNRLLDSALQFISSGIRNSGVYKLLKPSLDTLAREVLFPICCFSKADQELWEEDPVEFLRREHDVFNEFYNPRNTAANLVADLARYRPAHLAPLMTFLAQVLQNYATVDPSQRQPGQKEGALQIIGWLEGALKKPPYRSQLEPMLISHIIPEFSSKFPFLRARACWVFAFFHDVEFSNPAHFYSGLQGVLHCLADSELPVKIKAALALRDIVENSLAQPEIKKILPQLLETYLKMMTEMDNDDLVNALEILIQTFAEDMGPYAVVLMNNLVTGFTRLWDNVDNPEGEESAITAMEYLGAMQTLMDAVSEIPQLWPEFEKILLPLVEKLLQPEAMEFVEETYKLLTFLTLNCATPFTAQMWAFYPRVIQSLLDFGFDFMGEALPVLDNFVSRDTATFLSANLLPMSCDLVKRVISDINAGEQAAVEAARFMEVILQACKGKVDHVLESFMELSLGRCQSAQTVPLKVVLVETILNAMFYNPVLTLQILEKRGWTAGVFSTWFQSLPLFKRPYDKKLSVMALCNLLTVPTASLPALVQGAMLQVVETIITQQADYDKLVASIEEEEEKLNEEEKLANDNENESPALSEDETEGGTTLNDLVDQVKGAEGAYNEEEDEDFELEDEFDDDEFYSVLDKFDEVLFFFDCLTALNASNPAGYQQIINSLSPQSKTRFQELVNSIEVRKTELAERLKDIKY